MKHHQLKHLLMLSILIPVSGLALAACSKTNTPPSATQQSKTTETGEARRKQIKDIAASTYNGIALLHSKTDKKNSGTAVFISPDTLLTNRHVVTSFKAANETVLRTVNQQGEAVELPVKELIAPEDESMDVGIVKLQEPITENKELSHIKIQKIASLETVNKTTISDFIRAVGYPGDKEHGTLWDSHGKIKDIDGNFITYTALITSGSSGSPLFNKNDELIGLANASTDDLENPTSFGLLFDTAIRTFIHQHQ